MLFTSHMFCCDAVLRSSDPPVVVCCAAYIETSELFLTMSACITQMPTPAPTNEPTPVSLKLSLWFFDEQRSSLDGTDAVRVPPDAYTRAHAGEFEAPSCSVRVCVCVCVCVCMMDSVARHSHGHGHGIFILATHPVMALTLCVCCQMPTPSPTPVS